MLFVSPFRLCSHYQSATHVLQSGLHFLMDPHSKSTEALERKMIIHVEVYSALSGLPKVAVYSCSVFMSLMSTD